MIYDRRERAYRLVNSVPRGLSNSEILAVCKILLESRSMRRDEMMPILDKLIDCCVPEESKRAVTELIANEKHHYVEPHHGKHILDGLWEIGQAVKHRQVMEITYERILPELELIEAFFQAEELKNEIICGNPLENLSFTFYIQALENTPYHRHYQFVKNAFAFYVLSCRIYNTPVLTNLLQNRTTENDISQLEDEKAALVYQSTAISETAMVPRGGE